MKVPLRSGVVTGLGSLPHVDPVAAARFVLDALPALPSIPTLPRRSCWEAMVPQALAGVAGIGLSADGRLAVDVARVDPLAPIETDLGHEAFGGLRAFLAEAKGRRGPVKWQLTGPLTVGLALTRRGLPPSTAFDVAIRAVRQHLCALHEAITDALPQCPQVVFLDEPGALTLVQTGFPLSPDTAIDLLSGALAAIETTTMVGVHHCGAGDWAAIAASGPSILSLPARPELVHVAGYLGAFLDSGGWIAWGVVPTDRPVASSPDRYWRELADLWCALIRAGCRAGPLLTQAILTPACGLALHGEDQAATVLRLVSAVAERVEARAGEEPSAGG
jgi:hypothetical protein